MDTQWATIDDLGNGLGVVIMTEPGRDWETFSTWYSFWKNLPEAAIQLVCLRNGSAPFQYFQWAKRLKVHTEFINPEFDTEQQNWLSGLKQLDKIGKLLGALLIVRPLVMALDAFNPDLIKDLNESELWIDDDAWFWRYPKPGDILNDMILENKQLAKSEKKLCMDVKNPEPTCFASYGKGCGRWLHTAKGCPFSCAAGLVSDDMTINENRVIELWKKMVPLFHAVS